ncbi:glycosyltransferase [Cryobacterium levicorallinum]|uniref:glycosyltransferase n=1 Tax=Cryobacterium levicorallinum TaxID=995038 RepID=UPI00141B0721|nr:glycosyltransferase [Cryobacterium levicorallinum]
MTQVAPVMGLERVLLDLCKVLSTEINVSVTSLGGNKLDLATYPKAVLLGKPIRGLSRIFSLSRALKFRKLVPKQGAIVVVGVWAALPWLLAASRQQRRRTIVWEHSLVSERMHNSRKMQILNLAARMTYPSAKTVIAVSEQLAGDLAESMRLNDVRCIPNLVVDAGAAFKPSAHVSGSGRSNSVVISVGSLTLVKQVNLLLEAMVHLPVEYSLIIVGGGPERSRLEALSTALGVQKRVTFLGMTPHDRVLDLIRNSDVLVHSSKSETFGLAYVEAGQCMTPVVAVSNRAAHAMIPKYAPGIVTTHKPIDIAASIVEAISQPPSLDDYARSHNARLSDFDPLVVSARWLVVLEEAGFCGVKESVDGR